MLLEYVAAGALAELRQAAQPASLNTAVLSRGADASFANLAAQQLERSVEALRVMLGCELVESVQLLSQRGLTPDDMPTDRLRRAARVAFRLSGGNEDRPIRDDLAAAQLLLADLSGLG